MRRSWLVAAAVVGASPSARADVFLSDPVIEIGVLYNAAPTRLAGEMDTMVGSALHVTDRNGEIAGMIGELIGAWGAQPMACPSADTNESGTMCKSEEYITEGSRRYIRTTWQSIMPDEPRAAIDGVRADLALYDPRDTTSNTRGWSLGVAWSFARSPHAAVELGFQWSFLAADVCATSPMDGPCRYRFAGVIARASYDIGIGTFDAGVDLNGRAVFQETRRAGEYASPLRLGFTLDILDRVYVRGEGHAAPRTITEPGFAVELGARL